VPIIEGSCDLHWGMRWPLWEGQLAIIGGAGANIGGGRCPSQGGQVQLRFGIYTLETATQRIIVTHHASSVSDSTWTAGSISAATF